MHRKRRAIARPPTPNPSLPPQRDVFLFNNPLPQAALGRQTPTQTMQKWFISNSEFFHRKPDDQTGCDELVVSDIMPASRPPAVPSVPRQRCPFHLQQNAQAYLTRLDQRQPVARRIRAIFNAPDQAEAERRGPGRTFPRASSSSACLTRNAPGGAPPAASNASTARSSAAPVSPRSSPTPRPACALSRHGLPSAMRTG